MIETLFLLLVLYVVFAPRVDHTEHGTIVWYWGLDHRRKWFKIY